MPFKPRQLGSSSLSHQNPLPSPPPCSIPSHVTWGWREGGDSQREAPVPALPRFKDRHTPPELASIPRLSPTLPQVRHMGVEVTFLTSGSGRGALGVGEVSQKIWWEWMEFRPPDSCRRKRKPNSDQLCYLRQLLRRGQMLINSTCVTS